MNEYSLSRPESIKTAEVLRLIEKMRELLPALEPNIINVSEALEGDNDEDMISVVLSSKATYVVENAQIIVEEDNTDSQCLITTKVKQTTRQEGASTETIDTYTIDLDSLVTSYSKDLLKGEPVKWDKMSSDEMKITLRAMIKNVSIKMQVDSITGDDILTRERYHDIMNLLGSCGPHSLVD